MAAAENTPDTQPLITAFQVAEKKMLSALGEMREITLTLSRRVTDFQHLTATDQIFIEHLRNGYLAEPTPCSRTEAALWIETEPWDILIDEINHVIRIRKGRDAYEQSLHELDYTPRGWLWLILTHVGNALTHWAIANLFGLPERGRHNRIHQMKVRVGKFLGPDLASRIFGKGINRAYPIHGEGWSFLWIRKSANPKESELLPEDLRVSANSPA